MRPGDRALAKLIDDSLREFDLKKRPLVGVKDAAYRASLVEQIVESERRIRFITRLRGLKDINQQVADAGSELFDPFKAALLMHRNGMTDEAYWLVFLSVHFGKPKLTGWRIVRDVYGQLGTGVNWDWERTSKDVQSFLIWLAANLHTLKGADGVKRRFGNHRKYQSLHPYSPSGTGAAFGSYIDWVGPTRTHQVLFQKAANAAGGDPKKMFSELYESMSAVISFGRTAKFDYLTMIGKLGLLPIEPGATYMQGATGPLSGARLLFAGNKNANLDHNTLELWLIELEAELHLYFGMQILEDALCNWQKSPGVFRPFRG